MLFHQHIQQYINGFQEELPALPDEINSLTPYQSEEAVKLSSGFYKKFYNDESRRSLILGINPGRHGAGMTGVPFTDSKRLVEHCGISSSIKSHEPSSEFIYKMIEAYGGTALFYNKFFISSISPIGFTKHGKNYNYYDDRMLTETLSPYMKHQMRRLLSLPLQSEKVICLGEGKNYKYLTWLNQSNSWFSEIIPLAHPRFIMQYKRKELDRYIELYIKALNSCTGNY